MGYEIQTQLKNNRYTTVTTNAGPKSIDRQINNSQHDVNMDREKYMNYYMVEYDVKMAVKMVIFAQIWSSQDL